MCVAPAGTFTMGSVADEPFRGRRTEEQRAVTLTRSFLIGQFEVTQAEWERFGFINRSDVLRSAQGGGSCIAPDCPVTQISWQDALVYANARSRAEGLPECVALSECRGSPGVDMDCAVVHQADASYYDCRGYRLPTNAEREYAMRAGTTTTFPSGDFVPVGDGCVALAHLDAAAWYCANGGLYSHPVGTRAPNAWGLFDMMGNVGEFTASSPPTNTLGLAAQTDPDPLVAELDTVGFGGSSYEASTAWLRSGAAPFTASARPTIRNASASYATGFRLVRSLTVAEAVAW